MDWGRLTLTKFLQNGLQVLLRFQLLSFEILGGCLDFLNHNLGRLELCGLICQNLISIGELVFVILDEHF